MQMSVILTVWVYWESNEVRIDSIWVDFGDWLVSPKPGTSRLG